MEAKPSVFESDCLSVEAKSGIRFLIHICDKHLPFNLITYILADFPRIQSDGHADEMNVHSLCKISRDLKDRSIRNVT